MTDVIHFYVIASSLEITNTTLRREEKLPRIWMDTISASFCNMFSVIRGISLIDIL